ncbi:MAG: hypothetical protein GX829_07155 [Clostridium sp.]|jgi:hypothetical protein|nr:hypothetical protein [Clostridium sp.]
MNQINGAQKMMKINNKMIDNQLRIPGKIFSILMKPTSEEDFRRIDKISARLSRKTYKGLKSSLYHF